MLNIVVGQKGGDSVEVDGGQSTKQTAAQLGKSVKENAGTGGGGGSFVYTTADVLLLAKIKISEASWRTGIAYAK